MLYTLEFGLKEFGEREIRMCANFSTFGIGERYMRERLKNGGTHKNPISPFLRISWAY